MKGRSDQGREPQRFVLASRPTMPGRRPGTPPARTTVPDDDLAVAALSRYAAVTAIRPASDLALRVNRRIDAEPALTPPGRFLSAVRAGDVRAAKRAFGWTLGSALGRAPAPGAVRFRAIAVVVATFMVVGGSTAAGLAGVQLIASVVSEETTPAPASLRRDHGTTVLPSGSSGPPSAVGASNQGGGASTKRGPDGLASDDTGAEPEDIESEPDPAGPPPEDERDTAPKDAEEGGEDRARPDRGAKAGPNGPNGPKAGPNGPKDRPKGPKGESNEPKGPNGPKNDPGGSRPEPDGSKQPDRPTQPDGPKKRDERRDERVASDEKRNGAEQEPAGPPPHRGGPPSEKPPKQDDRAR